METKKLKRPTTNEVEKELQRVYYNERYGRTFRSTMYALITVAAIAVLIATLFLPVLQIHGTSMAPTVADGELVISVKGSEYDKQDVVAFYYNNKLLVKRVIANPGEWVDIDEYGNVTVNGDRLNEPYLMDKAMGECDIELPYQVPEGRVFVMGDHRSVSVDSRSSAVGCVAEEQVVGKLAFRIWPFNKMGKIK